MTRKVIHVALNGVTGRMGYRQHLVRSLLSIREQGGVQLADGTAVYPEPVLVGRSEERLRDIASRHGLDRWTTDLDEVLADPEVEVYFDTQLTSLREASLMRAIEEKYGSAMSCTTTPTIALCPVATALACRFAV